MAHISTRLVMLDADKVHQGVDDAFNAVREFFQCDRCGLLSISEDGGQAYVTHGSYGENIPRVPGGIDRARLFPWARKALLQGQTVNAGRLSDLPPEAEADRKAWEALEVRSTLEIPLHIVHVFRYVIVAQTLRAERSWPNEYVPRLRMLGEVIVSALERAKVERALRESEARLRVATDSAGAGVWSWDYETSQIWATDKALELHGLVSSELLTPDRALDAIDPEDRARVRSAMLHAFQRGEGFNCEYRVTKPDGCVRWIRSQGQAHLTASGEPHCTMGVSSDITDRKRHDAEMAELRQEVAHLARIMTMNELSTALAHEINQPLGAILNNASAAKQLMANGVDSKEEIGEILTDIVHDATRAGEVIRRLRDTVRKADVKLEPLCVSTVIEYVIGLLQSSISLGEVSLTVDLSAEDPMVMGDRVRLQQVLVNLITNAMEAMFESPSKLMIVSSRVIEPGTVTVSVCDSGAGLTPATMERVFEPFFTSKKAGLGLGLRICRSIIEEHGGQIWAENNLCSGATFSFSLNTMKASNR